MDNTIRLWDHQNIPIKVLEINTCANSIAFSSQRGDIVFGAGRHLYRISYCHYLSPKYRARILMNGIPEENEEEMIPENKDYRVYESIVDREFLLHPVSSAPLGSLDISDGDAPRLELMIQGQMCAQLRRRDQDVISIEKGEIKAVKLVTGKSLMNQEAWEKYLDDILGRSNKTSTEVPPYDVWAMVEKYKTMKRYYNKPGIFKMFYGYSIEKFPEYPEAVPDEVQHPHLRLFGFLPNSVIYKLFDIEDVEPPPPVPEPQPLLKYEYPPEFLLDQLHETNSSRLDSNVEMTPSQLINLTNVNDIDSETTVLRVSVPVDQNPFVKAAQSVSQYRYNSKMKRCRTRRAYHDHVDKKKTYVKKTLKRKNKPRGKKLGIPLLWTVREEFSNIDDLARLGTKEIVLQLESIKQTIKNNYGSISTLHDNKIKDTLMVLLARFVNSPSSFSVILNLLNIIPVNNIDIIGFLCTIFIITSRRIIRKSVLKYLKNHGLRDPQKVLAKQLLMVKKVTDTTNLFEVKKFVSRMISDWIYTLERHVVLIAKDIKCSDNFEHVRSAVKKEGNPLAAEKLKKGRNLDAIDFKDNECAKETDQIHEKWCHTDMHDGCVTWKDLNEEIVFSPIEGINYFCEMNIEFSNIPKDPQQSSQHTCGRHSKCKASQVRSTYTK
ncbi:uncharacterized protein LOC124309471 [Neodiprion virginianus]|uniref:uncharacterized protein LOC124309471 n=1 Tax=Neodiprion virginianus TaxID=2961670 RepID=UPI001EE76196|nr:uncharacterized protein LOC124309471 [Neodiprion virginianus]